MSDCLNDRLKVTFDDQEVTEMRKINRSDVLMAYQEKYGGYGTNDDECGFDYFDRCKSNGIRRTFYSCSIIR